MSAPPMPNEYNQQPGAMPAAPPSYDASMAAASGQAGGFAPPTSVYPGLPEKGGAYPPPQQPPQSYPAPQQPPQQVVTQIQYVNAPQFGYRPMTMNCPHCQAHITTRTQSEPSVVAWIVGGVLCLIGFWCCACIPCCVDSMQQVTHSCPSCNNFLGRYKGGM